MPCDVSLTREILHGTPHSLVDLTNSFRVPSMLVLSIVEVCNYVLPFSKVLKAIGRISFQDVDIFVLDKDRCLSVLSKLRVSIAHIFYLA